MAAGGRVWCCKPQRPVDAAHHPSTERPCWLPAPRTRAGCHHTPDPAQPTGPPSRCATMGPSDADNSPRSEPGRPLMTRSIPRLVGYATVGAGVAAAGYVGLVTGACPVDLGGGRTVRPLAPHLVDMAAPREVVFDVIAQPHLGRAPRALADKLRVLERGNDMVLAAHFTPLGGRLSLVAQTVETVRFARPERVEFRLVRGPVPHVVEAFELTEQAGGAGTRLTYDGEIGADLWRAGGGGGAAVPRPGGRSAAAPLARG